MLDIRGHWYAVVLREASLEETLEVVATSDKKSLVRIQDPARRTVIGREFEDDITELWVVEEFRHSINYDV